MASLEKPPTKEVEHREAGIEDAHASKSLTSDAAARGQGLTGYESLSAWETVKAFKMNALICFIVTISAATDGYQIG